MANTTGDGVPADPDELGLEGGTTTDLSPLVDVPFVAEYTADGDLADIAPESAATVTPAQAELVDELADGGFGTEGFGGLLPTTRSARAPNGPSPRPTVQVESTWRSRGVAIHARQSQGHRLPIEFAVEATWPTTSEAEEGTEVDGEMTLTGTISGDAVARSTSAGRWTCRWT